MKLHTWLSENGHSPAWLAEQTGLSVPYVYRLMERFGLPPEKSPSMATCALITKVTAGAVTANDFVPVVGRIPKRKRPQRKREHRNAGAAAQFS